MNKTVEMGNLAIETGAWALWETEEGTTTFQGKSKLLLEKKIKSKPIEEWMKYQGRFKHVFVPKRDEDQIKHIQQHTDAIWDRYRKEYLQ